MKLPRDVSGCELVRLLERRYDYELVRQTGSDARLTARRVPGAHHVTVPMHDSIHAGTLASILS